MWLQSESGCARLAKGSTLPSPRQGSARRFCKFNEHPIIRGFYNSGKLIQTKFIALLWQINKMMHCISHGFYRLGFSSRNQIYPFLHKTKLRSKILRVVFTWEVVWTIGLWGNGGRRWECYSRERKSGPRLSGMQEYLKNIRYLRARDKQTTI